jgi:hypothetical protein
MLREGPRFRATYFWSGSSLAEGPVYSVCMREYDEPDGELISPEDLLAPDPIPADARRLGLDRNTEEGALIALAGSLDPGKLSHRVIAWVLIIILVAPVLLGVLQETRLL